MTNIVLFLQDAIRGMKSYGARSLIQIDDTNVITTTLSLIRGAYRKAPITVVSEFDPAKIKTKPYKNIEFIRHHCAKEVLSNLPSNHIIFFNHDVVFNDYLLHSIPRDYSALIFDNRPINRSEICGLTQNGKVVRLAYGLDDKYKNVHSFSHIYNFVGQELELFKELLSSPEYQKYTMIEIVNLLIDNGAEFQAITEKKNRALVVTSPADITKLNRLMR